jgi:hypothetical protein
MKILFVFSRVKSDVVFMHRLQTHFLYGFNEVNKVFLMKH